MTRFRSLPRRPARYAVRVPCQVVREKDFRLVADAVVELSAGGALVGPGERVLTGERVILSFPDLRGGWIDAEAVVARVVHGRRAGERTRQLGLAFEALDESSTRALERLLASRVVPTSGSRRDRRVAVR
jgi:hypothetical protein